MRRIERLNNVAIAASMLGAFATELHDLTHGRRAHVLFDVLLVVGACFDHVPLTETGMATSDLR